MIWLNIIMIVLAGLSIVLFLIDKNYLAAIWALNCLMWVIADLQRL